MDRRIVYVTLNGILLLLFSCNASFSFAQGQIRDGLYDHLVEGILRKQEHTTVFNKTTAHKQRLILRRGTKPIAGSIPDSAKYFYNANNNCGNYMTPDLLDSYSDEFDPTHFYDRVYWANQQWFSGLMQDSMSYSYYFGSFALITNGYTYNTVCQPTQWRGRAVIGGSGNARMDMVYDAVGNQVEAHHYADPNNVGQQSKYAEVYNTFIGNKLAKDSLNELNDSTRASYLYNGNYLVQVDIERKFDTTYQLDERYTFTYDQQGRLLVALFDAAPGSSLIFARRDTFGYQSSYTAAAYWQKENWSTTGSWFPVWGARYHFLSSGLRDTIWYYANGANGGIRYNGFETVQYNSYNNISLRQSYDTAGVLNWINNYYYEEYEPTGINGTASPEPRLAIYPNPAGDMISVSIPISGKNGNLAVYDMSGRLVAKRIVSAETTDVDISQLPPGTYSIRYDANENIATGSFIKR